MMIQPSAYTLPFYEDPEEGEEQYAGEGGGEPLHPAGGVDGNEAEREQDVPKRREQRLGEDGHRFDCGYDNDRNDGR